MITATASPRSTQPQEGRTPSAAGYWTGCVFIAAGLIGAIVWAALGWLGLMHHVDGFQRTAVPGTATVRVNTTATRVLYFEAARHIPAFSASDVIVTGPDDSNVPVVSYPRDLRYDVPGDSGRVGSAVASFRPTVPGSYHITVSGGSVGTLALGDDVVWNAVPHVIGAGAVFLIGVGLGVTLIVTTAIRRSRAGSPR